MSVVAWIVLGFLAGALAERATGRRSGGCLTRIAVGVVGALVGGAIAHAPGRRSGGGLTRIAIGVVGALVGGAIANAAGERGVNDFSLWSLLVAFAGASLLLLVFGAIDRR